MTANEMKKQLIVWETMHLSGLKGLGKGYLETSEIVCACQVGLRPGEGSSALPLEEQVQTTAARKAHTVPVLITGQSLPSLRVRSQTSVWTSRDLTIKYQVTGVVSAPPVNSPSRFFYALPQAPPPAHSQVPNTRCPTQVSIDFQCRGKPTSYAQTQAMLPLPRHLLLCSEHLKSALCPDGSRHTCLPPTLQIHYLSEKKPRRTQVRPEPHLKSPLMGVVGPAVVLIT